MDLEDTPAEKEIDGIYFLYRPMMLKQARTSFDELAQRFGPAVAAAVEGLGNADINSETMEFAEMLGNITDSAGGALRGFLKGLDPAYHAKLADALAKRTEYKSEEGNYVPIWDIRERMFATKLLTEAKLIGWCLSVQYADFLEPLATLGQQAIALRGMATSVSASRTASTGSSIASPPATNTTTP